MAWDEVWKQCQNSCLSQLGLENRLLRGGGALAQHLGQLMHGLGGLGAAAGVQRVPQQRPVDPAQRAHPYHVCTSQKDLDSKSLVQ